jgi:hypothetical protein
LVRQKWECKKFVGLNLFLRIKFSVYLPLSMDDFKTEILNHVQPDNIFHHKFTNIDGGDVFKKHILLHVQKPQTDRKKSNSKAPRKLSWTVRPG